MLPTSITGVQILIVFVVAFVGGVGWHCGAWLVARTLGRLP